MQSLRTDSEVIFRGHRKDVQAAEQVLGMIQQEVQSEHTIKLSVPSKKRRFFNDNWLMMVKDAEGPEDDRIARDI